MVSGQFCPVLCSEEGWGHVASKRLVLSVLSLGPCLLSEREYPGDLRLLLKLRGGAERRDGPEFSTLQGP